MAREDCYQCDGEGLIDVNNCPRCSGSGDEPAMKDTSDGGNQQPSGVRGDPGAPRTSGDHTRDKDSSSSPAITQALITALKGLVEIVERMEEYPMPSGSTQAYLAAVAALASAETGEP